MKKRGVALIWTLILSTILIITSTTMVSYIIKDSQFSVRIEESTQVYAAAKSGADWARWYLSENGATAKGTYNFNLMTEQDDNETTVVISDAPVTGGEYQVESSSSYNNVTRKLKYIVSNNPGNVVVPKTIVNDTYIGQNSESLDLQFDFWTPNTRPVSFGLRNSTGSMLFFDIDDSSNIRIGSTINGTTTYGSTITNIGSDINRKQPYIYRADLMYIKDTAAKLTIKKRDPADGSYTCISSANFDLVGKSFGDIGNLYSASGGNISYVTNDTAVGDGSYIAFTSSSDSLWVAIDNIYVKR